MATRIITWFEQDIKKPVKVQYLDGNVFSLDNRGNIIGVKVYDNGEPVALSGDVSANVIRADGGTVAVTGTATENQAYISLPQAALSVPGVISIIIKLTDGSVVTTLGAIVANVYQSSTDTPIDPGTIMPSIDALIAEINAAIASIPADYSSLWTTFAPTYSTSKAYAVGDYVTYNGGLYKCVTAIESGESWTANHWALSSFGSDLAGHLVDFYGITEGNPNLFDDRQLIGRAGISNDGHTFSGTGSNFNAEPIYIHGGFKANQQYTLSAQARISAAAGTGTGLIFFVTYTDGTTGRPVAWTNDTTAYTRKSGTTAAGKTVDYIKISFSSGGANVWDIADIEIDEGITAGTFIPYAPTAVDRIAREQIAQIDKADIIGTGENIIVDGVYGYTFPCQYPAGVYTIVYDIDSADSHNPTIRFSRRTTYNSTHAITEAQQSMTIGKPYAYTFEIAEPFMSIWLFAGNNVSDSAGRTLTINRVELHRGIYIDKDNGADVSQSITYALNNDGLCELGRGVYSVGDGVTMPDGSQIRGATGTTIELMPWASSGGTISLPVLSGETFDYWITTSNNLMPGLYRFTINVESTYTGTNTCRICFSNRETYNAAYTIAEILVERDADYTYTVYLPEQAKSIFVFGGINSQTTCTFTVHKMQITPTGHAAIAINGNDCTIQDINICGSAEIITPSASGGSQVGIVWCNPNSRHGTVTRCNINNFSHSGILAFGTGTPVDHGLIISDCFVDNCGTGINIAYNSEFHKIANCIILGNYTGIINRGGNNLIDGCGIDRNVRGIVIDDDFGSNGGHGGISNCTINHSDSNTGYGLTIRGTGRMLVNNCNFYYSKIRLENTNGNIISNCGFGSAAGIEIVDGQCSMIIGCIIRSASDTPITISNNTTAQVINCFTRSGAVVAPVIT